MFHMKITFDAIFEVNKQTMFFVFFFLPLVLSHAQTLSLLNQTT